jgi:hypothetical protein
MASRRAPDRGTAHPLSPPLPLVAAGSDQSCIWLTVRWMIPTLSSNVGSEVDWLKYSRHHCRSRWSTESSCSIYVNPTQSSLAILFSLSGQEVLSGTLHLCEKRFLHYSSGGIDDRMPVRRSPSVRTQASRIVEKILKEWAPAKIFIGTGDPDHPELIDSLALPDCWERRQ